MPAPISIVFFSETQLLNFSKNIYYGIQTRHCRGNPTNRAIARALRFLRPCVFHITFRQLYIYNTVQNLLNNICHNNIIYSYNMCIELKSMFVDVKTETLTRRTLTVPVLRMLHNFIVFTSKFQKLSVYVYLLMLINIFGLTGVSLNLTTTLFKRVHIFSY